MDEPTQSPISSGFQPIKGTSTADMATALDPSQPYTSSKSHTLPSSRNSPRRVFFPISPGMNYHLGNQLQKDIAAANALNYQVTFVLADYLQRWTFQFEQECGDLDKICQALGNDWLKKSENKRAELKGDTSDIIRWKTLLYDGNPLQEEILSSEFLALLHQVERKHEEDVSFCDLIDAMAAIYLQKRKLPRKHSGRKLNTNGTPCKTYADLPNAHDSKLSAMEKSRQYIMEEAAIVHLLALRFPDAYFYYPQSEGAMAIFMKITAKLSNDKITWLNEYLNVTVSNRQAETKRLKHSPPQHFPLESPSKGSLCRSKSSSDPISTEVTELDAIRKASYRQIAGSMGEENIAAFLTFVVKIHPGGIPRRTVSPRFLEVLQAERNAIVEEKQHQTGSDNLETACM